ncbi:hypothetical protein [Paenibacillus kribbensis]|uniref:hypothetical protein n=1 Tax=Paenibacillus kribbensis TaxID=172713 RepID=UPI0015B86744|nr:hypothetical protein [Paenibacillus kribbensis]
MSWAFIGVQEKGIQYREDCFRKAVSQYGFKIEEEFIEPNAKKVAVGCKQQQNRDLFDFSFFTHSVVCMFANLTIRFAFTAMVIKMAWVHIPNRPWLHCVFPGPEQIPSSKQFLAMKGIGRDAAVGFLAEVGPLIKVK